MKIYFHPKFYEAYNSDLLSEPGRMEAIINSISPYFPNFSLFPPATERQLLLGHIQAHINTIKKMGLFDISALATGAAIQAALTCLIEPAFAIARPGGHHAMINKAWGMCFFSSMAIACLCLHEIEPDKKIFIFDFDHHEGNGTKEILGNMSWVEIFDIPPFERDIYLEYVREGLCAAKADVFAVSAGFDHHEECIGRQIKTEDYYLFGQLVKQAAIRNNAACFGIMEGGYDYKMLAEAPIAFLKGLS